MYLWYIFYILIISIMTIVSAVQPLLIHPSCRSSIILVFVSWSGSNSGNIYSFSEQESYIIYSIFDSLDFWGWSMIKDFIQSGTSCHDCIVIYGTPFLWASNTMSLAVSVNCSNDFPGSATYLTFMLLCNILWLCSAGGPLLLQSVISSNFAQCIR